jgi:hypothetical protein
MPYDIWCFLVGGHSTFSVSIDETRTRTVDNLKKVIKAEKPQDLGAVDADHLTLYHINAEQECIEKFSGTHRETGIKEEKLGPMRRLSQVFKHGIPEMTVHILVVSPQGPEPAGGSILFKGVWWHCPYCWCHPPADTKIDSARRVVSRWY